MTLLDRRFRYPQKKHTSTDTHLYLNSKFVRSVLFSSVMFTLTAREFAIALIAILYYINVCTICLYFGIFSVLHI